MHVQSSEVSAVFQGLLDGQRCEVLVTEGDDLLLGDEQGQLVLAFVVELGELDAEDLCANGGSDVLHLGTLQEILQPWIGILAMFVMLKRLERVVPEE